MKRASWLVSESAGRSIEYAYWTTSPSTNSCCSVNSELRRLKYRLCIESSDNLLEMSNVEPLKQLYTHTKHITDNITNLTNYLFSKKQCMSKLQKEGQQAMNWDKHSYQLSHTYDRFRGAKSIVASSLGRTEYQLLLMMISVRDRNVDVTNVFGWVLMNFGHYACDCGFSHSVFADRWHPCCHHCYHALLFNSSHKTQFVP